MGKPGFFFQAEDGIRDLVRSRGLGDVYKRQAPGVVKLTHAPEVLRGKPALSGVLSVNVGGQCVYLSLIHI